MKPSLKHTRSSPHLTDDVMDPPKIKISPPLLTLPQLSVDKRPRSNSENIRRCRICILSDFFYPKKGGVETHMYNLAECLQLNGHKVIVVTSAFDERIGIRHLTNGVKVYHLPTLMMAQQTSFIDIICKFIPILR